MPASDRETHMRAINMVSGFKSTITRDMDRAMKMLTMAKEIGSHDAVYPTLINDALAS